jgi:hypothetical protein
MEEDSNDGRMQSGVCRVGLEEASTYACGWPTFSSCISIHRSRSKAATPFIPLPNYMAHMKGRRGEECITSCRLLPMAPRTSGPSRRI